jgi:hypothetical protein
MPRRIFLRIIISGLNKLLCPGFRNLQAHGAALTPVHEDDFEENLPGMIK